MYRNANADPDDVVKELVLAAGSLMQAMERDKADVTCDQFDAILMITNKE